MALATAAVVRGVQFRGLYGSDDAIYSARALEVLAGIWSPSEYVGALRYGVNLPVAAFLMLLGAHEWALGAWGMLCSLIDVALVWAFAKQAWGDKSAICAALVLAFMPIHIDAATGLIADAPFAAALTLAAFLVHRGTRSDSGWFFAMAGLACGFQGWVKLEASLVSLLVIATLAFASRQRLSTIALVLAGAILPYAAQLALFGWAFGDPLYYFAVSERNLQSNFIAHTAPWGTHEAWYYLRLFFRDGRQFWIAPIVALGASAFLLSAKKDLEVVFVATWLCILFVFFSFFVYSISPFRFIPKQPNYAVFFAAPLALLAGFVLSRLSILLVAPVMGTYLIGGWILASIEGYSHRMHGNTHRTTIAVARERPDATVFAAQHTFDFNTVLRGLGHRHASNLRPLPDLDPSHPKAECGNRNILAMHESWPEYARWRRQLAAYPVQGEIDVPTTDVRGKASVEIAMIAQALLPSGAARQLEFARQVSRTPPVVLYSLCSAP